MSAIGISKSLIRSIEAEGCAAYPNECCGVLIGLDVRQPDGTFRRQVERIEPLTNSFEAQEQYHRFKLDGLEYARVEKRVGAEGKMILGFYHSHPDHPARPSQYDLDHAWPFYSYVIVEIAQRRPGAFTSWVLDEEKNEFAQQEIRES